MEVADRVRRMHRRPGCMPPCLTHQESTRIMSFLAWIVLGLIAGFIGSKIVNNTGQGLVVDILLGVVGAVVGGFLFNQFGEPGVSGVNLYSLLVAIVGAVIVLWLYHTVMGRRRVV